eukprot:428751_1
MTSRSVLLLEKEELDQKYSSTSDRFSINKLDQNDIWHKKFKWLDKWMLYLPLYVSRFPSKSNVPRPKCRTVFIAIFYQLIMCTMIAFYIWYVVTILNSLLADIDMIYFFTFIFYFISLSTARLFSYYYYYFYFNYPWYSNFIMVQTNNINS